MKNKNSTNHQNNVLEGVELAACLRENPTAPAWILVSTATHLVPGNGYFERTKFIKNLISQYHWSRNFERGHDRFQSYNAQFGYDNRTCYFLIDHGKAPNGNDDDIPILWYRWTGESLVRRKALPSRIRKRLKSYPFTCPKPTPRKEPSQTEIRENIRGQLRCDMVLFDEDFEFLTGNLKHTIWLERNIEPRFWSKFKALEAEWQELQMKLTCGRIVDFPAQREEPNKRPKDCTDF